MQNEQKLTGEIVEFQRDKNDPNTVKIRVNFHTWNSEIRHWDMLIPFKVDPNVTDDQLVDEFYAGREIVVNMKIGEKKVDG